MFTPGPGKTPVNDLSSSAEEQNLTAPIPAASEQEISSTQISLRRRLLNWRTLVPLAIVLGLLVYTAQKLHINPAQTWAALRTANPLFFAAAFLIYYIALPIRTLRWRILLENAGYTKKGELPHFWKLLEILYISWFANAIVPAKLGDVYRAYLLRQEAGVSATRTFGTVLAERLLDMIVLLLLFLSSILVSLHTNLPSYLRLGLYVTLALVLTGITVLILLRRFPEQIQRFLPQRLHIYYIHLQEGLFSSFRRIPTLVFLTLLIWFCEAGRFFFIILSLNLLTGSLTHIAAVATFIALGEALLTIVPFTSGGIGLVEGGMTAMLTLFMPLSSLAVAGVLLDRTISLLSILVFGCIVFLLATSRRASQKVKNPG